MSFASDLAATGHNFENLLEGKSSFNDFIGGEGKLIEAEIAKLPAVAQGAVNLLYGSFKEGASVLVGAGETALGGLINSSSDTQATMVLNLMTAAGIPTVGPLSLAEHAALVALLNGLKAGLDRVGLNVTLNNGVTASVAAKPAIPPPPLPSPILGVAGSSSNIPG